MVQRSIDDISRSVPFFTKYILDRRCFLFTSSMPLSRGFKLPLIDGVTRYDGLMLIDMKLASECMLCSHFTDSTAKAFQIDMATV